MSSTQGLAFLEPRVPTGYDRIAIGEQPPVLTIEDLLGSIPRRVLLHRIHGRHANLVAVRPIEVRIWKEGASFFAMNETLGLCISNEDRDSALDEFENDIAHFYNYYRGLRDDQVTGLAIRLKQLYRKLFRLV